jgi:hypothetical protein
MRADAVAVEVARRQQQRLAEATLLPKVVNPGGRSPWAHVPLAKLFEADGNATMERRGGLVESGHQPHHGSKSGRCVVISPKTGYWWCRGCRRSGDAVAYVMAKHGYSYRQAAAWLAERHGPPAGGEARKRGGQPRPRVEVVCYGR